MRVDSPGELIDACQAFVRSPRARGRRVAVIADGGGHGSVAADLLTANGLEVPVFSHALVARIEPQLEQAGGMQQPDRHHRRRRRTGVVHGHRPRMPRVGRGRRGHALGLLRRLRALQRRLPRGGAARGARAWRHCRASSAGRSWRTRCSPTRSASGTDLRASGLAAYERSEQAVARLSPRSPPPPPRPAVAAARARARRSAARPATSRRGRCCSRPASPTETARPRGTPTRPSRWPTSSRSTPSRSRPSTRRSCTSRTPAACASACADAAALRAAALDMTGASSPDLLFVERTADVANGVELVVGATRDARFGAVVLVGLGGILVETLRDTALALAPLDPAAAERLLRSLRAAAVLDGVRGRPAVDVAAAAARGRRARQRDGRAPRDRRARDQPPARHAARRRRARCAHRPRGHAFQPDRVRPHVDLRLTPDLIEIRERSRRFCDEWLIPFELETEEAGSLSMESYARIRAGGARRQPERHEHARRMGRSGLLDPAAGRRAGAARARDECALGLRLASRAGARALHPGAARALPRARVPRRAALRLRDHRAERGLRRRARSRRSRGASTAAGASAARSGS